MGTSVLEVERGNWGPRRKRELIDISDSKGLAILVGGDEDWKDLSIGFRGSLRRQGRWGLWSPRLLGLKGRIVEGGNPGAERKADARDGGGTGPLGL